MSFLSSLFYETRHGMFFWLTFAAFLLALSIFFALSLFLTVESFPVFKEYGVSFLTGQDWYPDESFGALPMIFGSFVVTGIALAFSFPLSISAAVITAEYLPPRIRGFVKALMELMSGVPGVVYGLIGVMLLASEVQSLFELIDGHTLFTAGVLLGFMVLPTMMTLMEDSLRAVADEFRENALAMGLSRIESILSVVIPKAKPQMIGAVLLGMGRAMGETMAVLLVVGSIDRIPKPWYNVLEGGQTIPSKLGREAAESLGTGLEWNALVGLSLLLFVMVFGLTTMGRMIYGRVKN